MLTIQTGSSSHPDPALAANEAISNLNTDKSPKLIFVYSSVEYDTRQLLHTISYRFPDAKLIGNTTFTAGITQMGIVGSPNPFVTIMAFYDDMEASVAVIKRGACPIQTGRELAQKALQKMNAYNSSPPSHFFMTATPGHEEEYLEGITQVLGDIPCFGGSAADNDLCEKWRVYTHDDVVEDGVAIAILHSPKRIENRLYGFYRHTEHCGVVTSMKDKRTVSSIDHCPALAKYCEWTGANRYEVQDKNLLEYSIFKPLATKTISKDALAIKHPMASLGDDILLSNHAQVGDIIVQLEATQDDLIKGIGKGLAELIIRLDYPIAGVHFVHCAGRKMAIANRVEEIETELKKVLGSIPFVVEFTFGEYGRQNSNDNLCAGLMLSATVFEK